MYKGTRMADVFVYIHGVVGRSAGPHRKEYRATQRGLAAAGVAVPSVDDSVQVEWGWPTPAARKTGELAIAQERLAMAIAQSPGGDHLTGFLVDPLRELIQYAWADLVYYATPEGEYHARHDVWSQILDLAPTDEVVDLTIISHSLGTLIAHDFLFHLFSGKRRAQRRAVCGTEELWDIAEANWRLRRLVTLGSPFGPLTIRRAGFVEMLTSQSGPWLDPADIGLDRAAHSGAAPIWLNVWDRHDISSFPVAGIYDAGDRVRDLYPDHSDWPPRAPGRYWKSRKVHKALAEFWNV
jgi:hypothetical protein